MPNQVNLVADLMSVPNRYMRSAQLETDFRDPKALENYILTPPIAEALARIDDGLKLGAGRRAWRITGDYGVGKSSFALALAKLLSRADDEDTLRIAEAAGWHEENATTQLIPLLVTAARTEIIPALAKGIADSLSAYAAVESLPKFKALLARAEDCRASPSLDALTKLIEEVRSLAASFGRGILLIIDELGKFLEFAAFNPDREDVYVLQVLAETAARSGKRPFVLVGLLHQGFQAYADRLPATVRHEWDKVAGRFDEIVFDQPLVHTMALVSGALGLNVERMPKAVLIEAGKAAKATSAMGWLGGGTASAGTLNASQIYPMHPSLLPVLVRFFAQFGQSERSLFSFLLSSEPFGLQAFSHTTRVGAGWFTLENFYDYARSTFGQKLAGGTFSAQWTRIVGTIDSAYDISPLQLGLLKSIGLLNVLDADDLVPTDKALRAIFSAEKPDDLDDALAGLRQSALIFQRGERSGYRLWPNTSVNLQAAFNSARRVIGSIESVSAEIPAHLERTMIMARRHYIERGTMRYFEIRHSTPEHVETEIRKPTEADGLVMLVLSDAGDQVDAAIAAALLAHQYTSKPLLVGVLRPIQSIGLELLDLRTWQWVIENTPELAQDSFAAAEVARQVSLARTTLLEAFQTVSGLIGPSRADVQWIYKGATFDLDKGLADALSRVCDTVFSLAPRIENELINRNSLSSPASAARMRLIEGIFNAADRPLLGIDAVKAPPEKSMYLSVLHKGQVHLDGPKKSELLIPAKDKDPLNLRPALTHILDLIRAKRGERIALTEIFAELKRAPYGVRDGVAPLLLALVMRIHTHELAVYEHGTFLPVFGAMEFQRTTRAPEAFEVQHCSVEGVRAEVFSRLADCFASGVVDRRPVLLDVVQELCQFAAKLPEYTRKTRSLSPTAIGARDALLSAREPATLLFADLPAACGFAPFDIGGHNDEKSAEEFVTSISNAISELQTAYPLLLRRITETVGAAIENKSPFDRAALAARASRVALAAREPRLRTFASHLRDPALNDDAWAESVASFVVSRPPNRWAPGDEPRFGEEIGALAEIFAKAEAAAFSNSLLRPAQDAVRLNLTRGDGTDLVRVLHPVELDEADQEMLDGLSKRLPQGDLKRIQFLTNLLWRELEKDEDTAGTSASSTKAKGRQHGND